MTDKQGVPEGMRDKELLLRLLSGRMMSPVMFNYAMTRITACDVQQSDAVFWTVASFDEPASLRRSDAFWTVATVDEPVMLATGSAAFRLACTQFGRDPMMNVGHDELLTMSAHARRVRGLASGELAVYKRWLSTTTIDVVRGAAWSYCLAHRTSRPGQVSNVANEDSVVAPHGFTYPRDHWVFSALEQALGCEERKVASTIST